MELWSLLYPLCTTAFFLKKLILQMSLSAVLCTASWNQSCRVFSVHHTEHGLYLRDDIRWPCLCCTGVSGHMMTSCIEMWRSEHVQWSRCECRTQSTVASSVFIVWHQSIIQSIIRYIHNRNFKGGQRFELFVLLSRLKCPLSTVNPDLQI